MEGLPHMAQQPLDAARLAQGAHELAARDPALAAILAQRGVPPLWGREQGFATLLLIILEQQVSLASARKTFERLQAVTGALTPERLLALDDDTLRAPVSAARRVPMREALRVISCRGRSTLLRWRRCRTRRPSTASWRSTAWGPGARISICSWRCADPTSGPQAIWR